MSRSEDYRAGRRVTWVGIGVNLFLIAVKFWAGVVGRSQALVADAVHSVSDLASDLAVLMGLHFGAAPADANHPFGHGRLETLASLGVGLALVVTALLMAWEAVDLLRGPPLPAPDWLAPAAAGLSLLMKEALYHYTMRVGRRLDSRAVMANAWHHRSDALSSLAALLGTALAVFNSAWAAADPLAALAVSALILWAGGQVTLGALSELVDTAPDQSVARTILRCARQVPGVRDVHDVRVRLSAGRYLVELHVAVPAELSVRDGHRISEEVADCLRAEVPKLSQVTIHLDPWEGPPEKR